MINFYPSSYSYLCIEFYDQEHGYWYARVGGVFEFNIEDARYRGGEWAILAKKSGALVVIAQSKNWRDRTGELATDVTP